MISNQFNELKTKQELLDFVLTTGLTKEEMDQFLEKLMSFNPDTHYQGDEVIYLID
jgi:hypothetical protein